MAIAGYAISGSGNISGGPVQVPRDTVMLRIEQVARTLQACEELVWALGETVTGPVPAATEKQEPPVGLAGRAMDLAARAERVRIGLEKVHEALA